jgi:hypothetical protein
MAIDTILQTKNESKLAKVEHELPQGTLSPVYGIERDGKYVALLVSTHCQSKLKVSEHEEAVSYFNAFESKYKERFNYIGKVSRSSNNTPIVEISDNFEYSSKEAPLVDAVMQYLMW